MFSTQANLGLALGKAAEGIKALVSSYAETRDELAFGGAFAALLLEGHTRAAVVGRHRAGDLVMEEEDDRKFAALVMEGEQPFLDGFVSDLSSGRYEGDDGTLDTAAIQNRALLYPRRMVGMANENFALASGEGYTFDWLMGDPETEHCADCPEIAAGSPYTWDTLPTTPGSNTTECLFNCLCSIVRSDGRAGFTLPG